MPGTLSNAVRVLKKVNFFVCLNFSLVTAKNLPLAMATAKSSSFLFNLLSMGKLFEPTNEVTNRFKFSLYQEKQKFPFPFFTSTVCANFARF